MLLNELTFAEIPITRTLRESCDLKRKRKKKENKNEDNLNKENCIHIYYIFIYLYILRYSFVMRFIKFVTLF